MGNLAKCTLFDLDKIGPITRWTVEELEKGVTGVPEMYINFYNYLIENRLDHSEILVFMNAFSTSFAGRTGALIASSNPEQRALAENVDSRDIAAVVNALDNAQNIDAFIQYNFIEPNLPETLKGISDKKKGTGTEPGDLKVQDDPDFQQLEKENEKLKAELDDKIRRLEQRNDDTFRQQEIEQLRDQNKALAKSAIDFNPRFDGTPAMLEVVRNRAIRNGIVSLIDLDNKSVSDRSFKYDQDEGTFVELDRATDKTLNHFGEKEFSDTFKGHTVVSRPLDSFMEKGRKKKTEQERVRILNGIASEFRASGEVTVFANSLNKADRSKSFFEFDKKAGFSVGDAARIFGDKVDKLKRLRSMFGGQTKYMSLKNLMKNTFKGYKAYLELSDDSTLAEKEVINLVMEKDGKSIILGNYLYTEYKISMRDVNGGKDYLDFLDKTISKIKSSNGRVDVTGSDFMISDPFNPGQRFNTENKIYQKDSQRFGSNADPKEAKKLSLKNAMKLYEEMGFAVSRIYIDKFSTDAVVSGEKSFLPGRAFIAVSPFQTAEYIDRTLQKLLVDNTGNIDYEELSKDHQISIIPLNRKELSFDDYFRLTKDNDSIGIRRYSPDGDRESDIRDYGKKDSMFGLGQSFPLHVRFAQAIEYLEDRLNSLPEGSEQRAMAETDVIRAKAFLFNDKNYYSLDRVDQNAISTFHNKVGYKKLENGDISYHIHPKILKKANENYGSWKKSSTEQKINLSRDYAAKLFGYVPGDKESPLYRQKRIWANAMSKGDPTAESNLMRQGGIFGDEILGIIRILGSAEMKSRRIRSTSFSELWMDTGLGGPVKGIMHLPTFNPVVTGKNDNNPGFTNARISRLASLNEWSEKDSDIASNDVSNEFLESEWMPMMPHFKIVSEELPGKKGASSGMQKLRNARRKNLGSSYSEKAVTSLSGISYDMTEQTAITLYNDLLGDIKGELEFMKSPIVFKDRIVIGRVGKNILQLHTQNGKVSERVLRHETMHRTVNEAVTPDTREKLYSEAKKAIVDDVSNNYVIEEEVSQKEADEWLAEKYEATYGNYGVRFISKLPKIVQDLFYFINKVYHKIKGDHSIFNETAQKLENGYYRNNGMNYDGYNGSLVEMSIGKHDVMANAFSSNLEEGKMMLDRAVQTVVSDTQYSMYGKYVLKEIQAGILMPKTYAKSLEEGKEILQEDIIGYEYEDDNGDIGFQTGKFQGLKTEHKELFLNRDGEFVLDDIGLFKLKKILPAVEFQDNKKLKDFYYAVLKYVTWNDLVIIGMPFTKDSKYHINVDGFAEELEQGNDINHDKLAGMFERSEMSARSTFSERVKFFLYNTRFDTDSDGNGGTVVYRGHVDAYFKKALERSSEMYSAQGDYTLENMVRGFREEVKSLEDFDDSVQYKTAKALFDRFFNPETESSFLSIGIRQEPELMLQSRAHLSVVNAILSAQKSVVVQEFIKVSSNEFGVTFDETRETGAKDYKNKTNESIVKRLFVKSVNNETDRYVLSDHAKKNIVLNTEKYNISKLENGKIRLSLHGKHFDTVFMKTSQSQQKNDLRNDFVKKISLGNQVNVNGTEENISGLTETETISILWDLGVNMSAGAYRGFKGKNSKNIDNVSRLIAHSYILLAKQYLTENPESRIFDEGSGEFIDFFAFNREDDVSKVIREHTRDSKSSNQILSNENPSDLGIKTPVYSPTTFNSTFEALGSDNKLNAYDSGDNIVYIMDGSKENKDKFPAYIHRALSMLSNIRTNSITSAADNETDLDEYRSQKYGAVFSNTYKNPVLTERNFIGKMFYMKGIKNQRQNRSKTFQDLNDREFSRMVLHMLIGENINSDFYLPMEVQADRSFLPVMKMNRNRRFYARQSGSTIDFDDVSRNELERIRKIPFHHAARSMAEIYKVLRDNNSEQRIKDLLAHGDEFGALQSEWKKLQKIMDAKFEENPSFIDDLTQRKHFVMIDGKPVLPPLLKKRMSYSKQGFLDLTKDAYIEFAEGLYATMKQSGAENYNLNFKLTIDMLSGRYENDKFKITDTLVNLFQEKEIGSEKYAKMTTDQKMSLYHPALLSAFTTYYVNETHLTQALSGDVYLYKYDEVTGPEKLHSYVTEYSKRQAGLTTPKIEMVYREMVTDGNGNQVVANKRGIGRKLNIGHINDMVHNTLHTRTHDLLSKANSNNEKGITEGFKMKTNDGQIYSSFLFQSMLRESMGSENGFKVGSLFKGHNYSFDLSRGDVTYTKGATMMINAQALKHDQGYLQLLLKGMLSSALITGKGYQDTSLYEILIRTVEDQGYDQLESKITDIYQKARNNEEGLGMRGDILHMLAPKATEKGNISGINNIEVNENGEASSSRNDFAFKQVDTEGFGVILDLQKDIENRDNDVSLSTQMVFLLGLNGDNHLKTMPLYREIANLSMEEKVKITDEIYDTVSEKLNVEKSGIIRNRTALRKWFLKKINDNYRQKGNYNLIHDLSSSMGVNSISHPALFEEIYSTVGSAISKGIVMRMNGFKAVQASSHNTFMTYTDSKGRYYTKPEIDNMTTAQLMELGISKRNLRYSEEKGDFLTDTEVFTGNVLAKKYLSKKDYSKSIREIFNVNGINTEAADYKSLARYVHKEFLGKTYSEFRGDFNDLPVFNGLKKKDLPDFVHARIRAKEAISEMDRSAVVKILVERTVKMNRALYGMISRIPNTGKNSSTPIRIVGFVSGYQNAIFTPAEWMFISGSDFDGDTVQLWNYDGNEKTNDKALDVARRVLSDARNAEEIYSEINFDFMDKKAKQGKTALLSGAKQGYLVGSLKTLIDLRSNNATGAALTEINATLAKVHSYATLAQTRFEHHLEELKVSKSELFPKLEAMMAKKSDVVFREKGKKGFLNTGILYNENGDYKNKKGEFIYKWNETLTNAAIDNAKHLFMNFIGLNSYNAGIQQAMTFMGFDPETMIEKIIKNKTVMNAIAQTMQKDDINASSRATLDGFIRKYFSRSSEQEIDSQTALNDMLDAKTVDAENLAEEERESKSIRSSLKDAPVNARKARVVDIDFESGDSVMRLLQFLNEASKEIHNIRKIVKVTDKIPGKSADQDYAFTELFNAVNNKIGGAKINTISSFKRLLNQMDEADNPLMIKEVVMAHTNSITTHPLVLLATMPHLREFAKRWLEFSEMKHAHILYSENIRALISQLRSQLDYVSMRNPRNISLINREVYKFINGVFLETEYSGYEFNGETYNMGNISDVLKFKKDFSNRIIILKTTSMNSNSFLNKLEVNGSDVVFPGSETMDQESITPGRKAFSEMPNKLKEAFMVHEAATSNFLYRKGSFLSFMDNSSFKSYNLFLQKAEKETGKGDDMIIRSSVDGQKLLDTFMINNVSLLKRMTNQEAGAKENNLPYSPKTNLEIQDSYDVSIKEAPLQFNLRTEQESFKEKVREIEEMITALQARRKPVKGETKKDLKIIEANGSIDQKIIVLEGKIAEMKNRSMTEKTEKGMPPFKTIRFWNKETNSAEFYVYKVVSEKGFEKDAKMQRIFFPAYNVSEGVTINPYRREGQIPTTFSKEKIKDDKKAVLQTVFDDKGKFIKGKEGRYITRDAEVIDITPDGNMREFKFSLGSRKATPQVKAKARAIVSMMTSAFPSVKVNLLEKAPGIFADRAGFVHNGEVFLNLDMIALDTPMHEFGHIFIDLLEKSDPGLYERISDLVVQTSEFKNVGMKYSQFANNDSDNIKETFVTLLGMDFSNNMDERIGDIGEENKKSLKALLSEFIEWIKSKFRDSFKQMGIGKKYINEGLLSDLNKSSSLNELFELIGGAVLDGKVITDLSTKEIGELEFAYNLKERKATEAEIDGAIEEMYKKGLIKNYC